MTEFILSYVEMLMAQYKFSSCADMFMTDYHVSLSDCDGWSYNSMWELMESATSFKKTIQFNNHHGYAELIYFVDNSVLLTIIEDGQIDQFIGEDAYHFWYDITQNCYDGEEYDAWAKPKHESNSPNHRNFLGAYAGLSSKQIREYKRSNFKCVRNPHGTKRNYRRS